MMKNPIESINNPSEVFTMGTKKVLFSGRFDPIHIGHWISILRLFRKHGKVFIVVLDYKERKVPAFYSVQVYQELIDLSGFQDSIQVTTNETHFTQITKEELESYKCDVYAAAGNMQVLKHVSQFMPCIYIDRAYEYEGSLYINLDKSQF